MEQKNITKFKDKLEKELLLLEGELKNVGRRNPSNLADWEAVPPKADIDSADRNEVADEIEHYETNTAILKDLEIKYNEVKDALEKMKKGNYGICEKCGEEIEEDRLNANPAARTCKADMNDK